MTTSPAGWYPDPGGRHELRYYDGNAWTEHVSDHGNTSVEPIAGTIVPTTSQGPEKIQGQVQKAGGAGVASGGGSLFTEPILVVNQKRKILEVNTEFAVFDQHGNQIGAVRQVGQSGLKKAVRFLGDIDQYLTHSFQVVDTVGTVQLTMKRPRKLIKSKLEVGDGRGNTIGEIVQENAIGKIRFGLLAGGQKIGSLNAENWRAWNFSIKDHQDQEVARITKTFEGVLTTMFTNADNYVLTIHRPLQDPLRQLVVGSALAIDVALKQDSRGLN